MKPNVLLIIQYVWLYVGKLTQPMCQPSVWLSSSSSECAACPHRRALTSAGVLVGLAVLCLSGLIGLTSSLDMILSHNWDKRQLPDTPFASSHIQLVLILHPLRLCPSNALDYQHI